MPGNDIPVVCTCAKSTCVVPVVEAPCGGPCCCGRSGRPQRRGPSGECGRRQQGWGTGGAGSQHSRRCPYCLPEREALAEADLIERRAKCRSHRAAARATMSNLAQQYGSECSNRAYRGNTAELLRSHRGNFYQRAVDLEQQARRQELQRELSTRREQLTASERQQYRGYAPPVWRDYQHSDSRHPRQLEGPWRSQTKFCSGCKCNPCRCDPCKCGTCKCDPCRCDPCKCGTCKCDPCRCDPCKCGTCKCDPCRCDPCKCGTCKCNPCRCDPCKCGTCKCNPCRCDPCKCGTCKCDPCRCDPCKCGTCKCNPCRCDPCKCGTCKCDPCRCDPCKCDPSFSLQHHRTPADRLCNSSYPPSPTGRRHCDPQSRFQHSRLPPRCQSPRGGSLPGSCPAPSHGGHRGHPSFRGSDRGHKSCPACGHSLMHAHAADVVAMLAAKEFHKVSQCPSCGFFFGRGPKPDLPVPPLPHPQPREETLAEKERTHEPGSQRGTQPHPHRSHSATSLQSPKYGRKVFITDDSYLDRRLTYMKDWERRGCVRRLPMTNRSPSAPLPERTTKWKTTSIVGSSSAMRE